MQIIQATRDYLPQILSFYEAMCQVLGKKSFLPNGNKGGFPSQTMIEDAIKQGFQFIGIQDDKLVAAYILNHDCDQAYHGAAWQIQAAKEETVVMHALRVRPEYGGQGFSKRLVEHAIQTAKSWGQKAIRLDCLKENEVAVRLYESYGFVCVDTVSILYADIGVPMECLLYELVLS